MTTSKAKQQDKLTTIANIKLCHDSLNEFHELLSDIILEEAGKGVADLDENVQTGIIIYEIQASFAAADKFNIPSDLQPDFVKARLMAFGAPEQMAIGMIEAYIKADSSLQQMTNGKEAYEALIDAEAFSKHVKNTLTKLQNSMKIARDLGL